MSTNKVIRILHVFGIMNFGGAESMIMNLYRNIDKSIQFDFIVHTNSVGAFDKEIMSLGGHIFHCPQYKGVNSHLYKKWWKNFFNDHNEYKILHSHIRSCASMYIPIAHKHNVKVIVHSHSTSNGQGLKAIAKKILQYPIRFQADYCFACSTDSGKWLFGEKIINNEKFFLLKNAIDTNKFTFDNNIRKNIRDSLNLGDSLTFVHVGRFHEAKNHIFLLNVFKDFLKICNQSKLILVGDGELRPIIETEIKKLGIANDVILTGFRNDISHILMASDCFIFPSLWEGLPVTVIEAQAAGLRCLISDRITKEVDVSNLVKHISISDGTEPWINEMKTIASKHYDVSKYIINSGYDICSTCKWLTDFYMEINCEKNHTQIR